MGAVPLLTADVRPSAEDYLNALARRRLDQEQRRLPGDMLVRHPIENYLELFAAPTYGRYWWVPPVADTFCANIEDEFGKELLECYHRLVLLTCIARYGGEHPPAVRNAVIAHMRGIVSQMDRNPPGSYLLANDRFAKDFAVCRGKLVPCGAQLVDVRAGIARSTVATQGPMGAITFLRFMLGHVGGFKVLFEMHMDPRLVLEFNPKGWERCYLRIAKLLEHHPNVLGIFGMSWWFDLAVHDISPQLDFLRDMPTAAGARLFRIGESAAAIGNALANSRERRAAYDRGAYKPTDWLMVWSRRDLIAWATAREVKVDVGLSTH